MVRHAHRVADVFRDEREERLFRRVGIRQIERVHLQIGVPVAINEGEKALAFLRVSDVHDALEVEEIRIRFWYEKS